MHLLNIIIKKMQNMQLENQMAKDYLANNKEQQQKKQKGVKEKGKRKKKEKKKEEVIKISIEEEIIKGVEVGGVIEVEVGIEIIIIEGEVGQKKLIFAITAEKKGIGLMNVVCQKKKGNYIYLII